VVPIRHYLDDELFGERQNHQRGGGRAMRENHEDVRGIWFCIPRLGRDGYTPAPPVDASTDSESSLASSVKARFWAGYSIAFVATNCT